MSTIRFKFTRGEELRFISHLDQQRLFQRAFRRGAVTLDKLAANSVNASKIVAGSITAAQIAANTITGDKIAATTIAAAELTEERRKELVKLTKKYGEECKVAMRNIRRKAVQDLKDAEKEGLISEDELHQGEKEIQKLTDDEVKNIEGVLKEKEAEIMAV